MNIVHILITENNSLRKEWEGEPFSKHLVCYSIQLPSFRIMDNIFYD